MLLVESLRKGDTVGDVMCLVDTVHAGGTMAAKQLHRKNTQQMMNRNYKRADTYLR